jgi:ABC-type phosphate transport system substrate-binding protein
MLAAAMMRASLATVVLLAGLAGPAAAQDPEYRVIVNASNPSARLTTQQVADYFLNRGAQWTHGGEVSAVDQSARSPIREVFTRRVMGRTVDFVVNHWKQRMMADRVPPPPVKGSDAEVIEYVGKNKGAIGYVGPTVALPASVKVVPVAGG